MTPVLRRTVAAVLFDLGGTLVDSTPAVMRSRVRVAVEEDEDIDPRRLQGFHGQSSAQIVAALAAGRMAAADIRPPRVVEPADCLVVEDAPSGLASARAAGCATLAATTTHSADELDADVVVTSLSEVGWGALAG